MAHESLNPPKSAEEGRELRIPCLECKLSTFHRVVRSAEYENDYVEGDFSIHFWDEYQIVECLGCRRHSFRHRHRDTEHVDHDPDTGEASLEEQIELYPRREEGRAAVEGDFYLPPKIRRVYSETLSALRSGMPVLAGIGVRAIVETVCKDRSAKGSSLEKQIDSLVDLGVLTKEGAEILHSLRIMGNEAAHEVKPHKIADLHTALDVIDYVMTGVYILPERAEHLPKRKLS